MNDRNIDQLKTNIKNEIRRLRKSGITAMRIDNLKQVTPVTGLDCHPNAYHNQFEEIAIEVCKQMKFSIL